MSEEGEVAYYARTLAEQLPPILFGVLRVQTVGEHALGRFVRILWEDGFRSR